MPDLKINLELLKRFEKALDPRFPERSGVPARVLGYGEISTVLELGTGSERDLAYKRLPMFRIEEEAQSLPGHDEAWRYPESELLRSGQVGCHGPDG